VTKKNASFINIPRYLTLQFLITDKSLLKLPKKIPNSISMTTPCKKGHSKIEILENLNLHSAQKVPLKDNSLNIDYKTYSKEINDVLSPLAGQRLTAGKNSNTTPRIPLSSTNLNQQKLNTKNSSINSNSNSNTNQNQNHKNTRTSFSKINKSKSSESQNDFSSTREQNSASQELSSIELDYIKTDSNRNENNKISLLEHEKYDPSQYVMSDISEDEQLKLAMELSLTDPVQNQSQNFFLSQECLRRTPTPLPQLDGNSDEFKSFGEPDIVEVIEIANEGKENQKIFNGEDNNNLNATSKLNCFKLKF